MPVCSTTVHLPQDEHKVVRVDRGWRFWIRNLYVGIRNEIPRPVTREQFIEAEWNKIIKEDLELHLRNINNEIRYACQGRSTRESLLEPELLLTGHEIDRSISLSPKIWFRCGSAWVEKVVQKETYGLSWMADRGLGDRIETGLESAVLVSDNPVPIPSQLSSLLESGLPPTSKLPYGYALHISIQKIPASGSPFGLLCSVLVKKHQNVVHHSICRIGGIITIHDSQQPKLFAVTTAHGLLDYFLRDVADQQIDHVQSYFQMAGDTMATATSFASSSLNRFFGAKVDTTVKRVSSTNAHGTISEQELDKIEWEPVERVSSTNWLGGGWEIGAEFQHPFFIPDPDRLTPDADFALLELSSQTYNNIRLHEAARNPTHHVKGWLGDDKLEPGAVEVILGSSGQPSAPDSVTAHLLHERPHLFLRGAPFPTRKLRLTQPLASGTSGAWVVRDQNLCGMIVASYDTEPFAHMITAEKMLGDMRKTLGSMFLGQPMITLPIPSTGMPPMALKGLWSTVADHQDPVAPGPSDSWDSGFHAHMLGATSDSEETTGSGVNFGNISAPLETKEPYKLATSDDTRERLYKAFVASAFHQSGKFLPQRSLEQVLTKPTVRNSMLQTFPNRLKADQLTKYILSSRPERSCLKIYGILVLLGKIRDIEKFADAQINDQHLPFSLTVKKSEETELESPPVADIPKRRSPPSFLMEWSYAEIDLFNSYQWCFCSPHFTRGAQGNIFHYSLQDNVILPWVEMGTEDAKGLSIVQKVKIHPLSHNLPSSDEPNTFAVKHYRSRDPDDFANEVDVLKRLKHDDPHFVNLLATFKHRNSYHMVFPWATGGSLYSFWRQHTAAPPLKTALPWFLEQALHLAEGLSSLHYPVDGPPIMHGDLKADNILLFKHGDTDTDTGGSLKIADFGCAGIVDHEDPQKIYSFCKTYRPPEIDRFESLFRSLDYDIWTLGCLYLEFIGWLLMGGHALADFAKSRLLEEEDNDPSTMYIEDKFFIRRAKVTSGISSGDEDIGSTFELKDSVTEYIARLRNFPGCPEVLRRFLDMIRDNMLRMIPADRLDAMAIAHEIGLFKEDAGSFGRQDASVTFDSSATETARAEWQYLPKASKDVDRENNYLRVPSKRFDFENNNVTEHSQHPDLNEDTIPIDVKTVDEFIAETNQKTATKRLIWRHTVERRHMWNTQNEIYRATIDDGGTRYRSYKSEYSNKTRPELDEVKIDSFARIAAANHVIKSGQVSKHQETVKADEAVNPPHASQISELTKPSPVAKTKTVSEKVGKQKASLPGGHRNVHHSIPAYRLRKQRLIDWLAGNFGPGIRVDMIGNSYVFCLPVRLTSEHVKQIESLQDKHIG